MEIGCVPMVKIAVKSTRARMRFIPTQEIRINIFFHIFALMKLSFAWKSSWILGSSPLSLTNHHKGIKFNVYSVPDLSVRSLQTFGGIPIPNSNTFTPLLFALIKCPNSWMRTRLINIIIPRTMVITFLKKIKLFNCLISYYALRILF